MNRELREWLLAVGLALAIFVVLKFVFPEIFPCTVPRPRVESRP